jgi:uncharacterized coiled-coil DUF342 family protein
VTTDPDNLVLNILREMRGDVAALRTDMDSRFNSLEARMDKADATAMKMWKQFIGHRSMTERTVTDVDVEIAQLKRRVSQLEAAQETST